MIVIILPAVILVGLGLVFFLYNKEEAESKPSGLDKSDSEPKDEKASASKRDFKKAFPFLFGRKKKKEKAHLQDMGTPVIPKVAEPKEIKPFQATPQKQNVDPMQIMEASRDNQVGQLKAQIQKLEEMLEEKNKSQEEMTQNLDSERSHREEFTKMQTMLQEEIQTAREKNKSLKEELAKAQEEIHLYENKIATLTAQLEGKPLPEDPAMAIAEEKIEEQLQEEVSEPAESSPEPEPTEQLQQPEEPQSGEDDEVLDNSSVGDSAEPVNEDELPVKEIDLTEADGAVPTLKDVFESNQKSYQNEESKESDESSNEDSSDDSPTIEISEDDLSK